MGVHKRSGSGTWQCEFVMDGERVRATTGTGHRRAAETFERQLRQRLYEQKVLGGIEEMPLGVAARRFDRTVMVPRGNELSPMQDTQPFDDWLASAITWQYIGGRNGPA